MLLAQLETDLGRGREAIVRLLIRARLSQRDPEPFAGLCYACRLTNAPSSSAGAALGRERFVERTVRYGYFGLWHGQHDAWFDTIRGSASFARLVQESRKGHDTAFATFQEGNGDAILRSTDP
jgi:hypothetical protein